MTELDTDAVAARLSVLREHYEPMDADEARRAMTPPPAPASFEQGVARRLRELRALDELTRHLHRSVRLER